MTLISTICFCSDKVAPAYSVNTCINESSSVNGSTVCYNTNIIPLCHDRLAHASIDTVKQFLSSCNISFPVNKNKEFCTACAMSKSHILPFTSSKTINPHPLELA